MNQIISLKVSDQEHINVFCKQATLDSITCCDKVSLVFEVGDKKIVIKEEIEVKQLHDLKQGIETVVNKAKSLYVFPEDSLDDFGHDECDGAGCCDDLDFDEHEQDDEQDAEDAELNVFYVAFGVDQCNNFSLDVSSFMQRFYNKTIPVQTLQSWIAQLDLLYVLTEENEKEKQSRGKGCC